VTCVATARAGGPLIVNGAGQPLVWNVNPVPYNPDQGKLGKLTNTQALAHLATGASAWGAVSTASVSLTAAASLPVDVTVSNYGTYLFTCGDGLSPIVFDVDGSITDDLLGAGANAHIIGFAAPACGTYVPPVILEGYSVLNGKFLDGVDVPGNPELTADEFDAVLTHELGHYLGMDHSQINDQEAFDGNPANDDTVATMFPILVAPTEMRSPNLDDEVSLSSLYPAPAFSTDFATIAGSILLPGGALFQGAHVIARNLADTRHLAVGYVSGATFFPGNDGGPPDPALRGQYRLAGLQPGSYTVEIEQVDPRFVGGSSVGPLEVPAALPGPPEFWNGVDESDSNPPDDPSAAVPITVAAGETVSGIDVVVNQSPPPPNDECASPTDVTLPFSEILDATGATQGAFDPLQGCGQFGSAQNSASVWYRFVAPADGVVHASTGGSSYDTVASLLTGACGVLVEDACGDQTGGSPQASFDAVVTGGTTYYVEVTSKASFGAILHIDLTFTPAAQCAAAPLAGCRTPTVPGTSSLRMKTGVDPAHQQLQWKWVHGAATTLADLGDPTTEIGTSYALCVYDASAMLVSQSRAPAGDLCGMQTRPCWRAKGNGFAYKDAAELPDGLKVITLKSAAAGSAKIVLKGAGAALALPPLPAVFPLTVQLVNSTGVCWEASYGPSGVVRNDGIQLKAKGG
jgi:hypothetical protein